MTRYLALIGMLLLGGCFSEDSPEPQDGSDTTTSPLRIVIEPTKLAARQNTSTVVRIDVPDVPDSDLPSGYSIDLPEQVSRIDVATAPCPAGVGSRACQDWTLTPLDGSIPASYDVSIATVGSRAGTVEGSFLLQVVADPAPGHGAALAIDALDHSESTRRVVLNDEGQVFVRGENQFGVARVSYQRQERDVTIMEPKEVDEFVAAPLPEDARWIEVLALRRSTVALRDDGTVWTWGSNQLRQLGFASSEEDGLGRTDRQVFGRQLQGLANVRSIALATPSLETHPYLGLVALLSDGRAIVWSADQPLDPIPLCEDPVPKLSNDCDREISDVRSIATGEDSGSELLAIKNDGTIWKARGLFRSGGKRVSYVSQKPAPRAPRPTIAAVVRASLDVHLAADGTVWQQEGEEPAAQVEGLEDITAIDAEREVFFSSDTARVVLYALRSDGTVWTWATEIVDDGASLRTSTPVQITALSGVIALGPGYALTGDCVGGGGRIWEIRMALRASELGEASVQPVRGFGENESRCGSIATAQVRVTVTGSGRIVSTPAGIDCSADCTARFPLGSVIRLHEAPSIGSEFVDFNSACEGSGIRVTGDLQCAATFRVGGERRLEVRVEGDGNLRSAPAGIDCGLDCSESYNAGRTVQFIATPGLGYTLGSYTGHADCSEGIVFMTSVRSCVARFVPLPAPNIPTGFVATPAANGTELSWDAVIGPVVRYTIERADASGVFFVLTGVPGDVSRVSDTSAVPGTVYTYRLIAENVSGASPPALAFATTAPPTQGRLTVTVNSTLPDAGVVTSTPAGIQCGTDCTEVYAIGTQVTLSATPASGLQFNGFTGDADCTDGVVTISAAALACTATFATATASGWVLLGGESLTVSGVAPSPSAAIGPGNVAFVAYTEAVPAGDVARLRVQRFDGTAWMPVGPAVNAGSLNAAFEPSLAFSPTGIPHVAWASNSATQRNILVARFNGTTWERVGPDMPLNYVPGALASNPSLAFGANGTPMVAWIENSAVKFKLFTGTAWVRAEGPSGAEGPASTTASRVKLSTLPANGTPVLAWSEGSSSSRRIRATSGLGFELLGSAVTPQLPLDASLTEFDVVAIASSQITVSWAQVGTLHSILAREWTGSAWSDLSPAVSGASQPFLSFSMSRDRQELVYSVDAPATNQSTARLFNRAFSSFIPSTLPSLTVPRAEGLRALSIAIPSVGSHVVAGSFVNSQDLHELRVYAVFP
jgi:hypothetical protein